MSDWSPNQLSDHYLRRAQQADDRVRECRQRISRSPGHMWAHDEALAEFYVYNRLHGRTFLETPQALVRELRAMKSMDFKTGSSAYEQERFERCRLQLIDDLLREFEPLAG